MDKISGPAYALTVPKFNVSIDKYWYLFSYETAHTASGQNGSLILSYKPYRPDIEIFMTKCQIIRLDYLLYLLILVTMQKRFSSRRLLLFP